MGKFTKKQKRIFPKKGKLLKSSKKDFAKFKKDMAFLKKIIKDYDKLWEIVNDNLLIVYSEVIDGMIAFTEDKYNDKAKWISWFIYENDFGKNGGAVSKKDGTEENIKTVQQLYYFCING